MTVTNSIEHKKLRQSVITRFRSKTLDGFDRSLLFTRTIAKEVFRKLVGTDSMTHINEQILVLIRKLLVFL